MHYPRNPKILNLKTLQINLFLFFYYLPVLWFLSKEHPLPSKLSTLSPHLQRENTSYCAQRSLLNPEFYKNVQVKLLWSSGPAGVYNLHQAYPQVLLSVWGPSNSEHSLHDSWMEDAQKHATIIILGTSCRDYKSALGFLNLSTFFDRTHELIIKFWKSLLTNGKHRSILPPSASISRHTRHNSKLEPVKCRTNGFANCFVQYFLSAINKWIESCAIFRKWG